MSSIADLSTGYQHVSTRRRRWTEAERQFIVETHGTLTGVEQARRLGVDYDCLCNQRQRLIHAGLIATSARKYARVFTTEDRARIVDLIQAGYSLARIVRLLHRSRGALIKVVAEMGGIKLIRRSDIASRVWTPRELGVLFGASHNTIRKWLLRGWIVSNRNARPGRLQRISRIITDEALQEFIANRAYWPAWHPSLMTDHDWQAHARELRHEAGGEWLPLAAIARRTGLARSTVYCWFRLGRFDDLATLRHSNEHFVWSSDVDALAARMRKGKTP